MTEERSCEEATIGDIEKAFNDYCGGDRFSVGFDTFACGFRAAEARTPTLPAGAERMVEALMNAHKALRLTREYVGEDVLPAIPGWSWFDASEEIKAVLADAGCPLPAPRVIEPLPEGLPTTNLAAGDRPPAEREES